jgi:hypothetical protein
MCKEFKQKVQTVMSSAVIETRGFVRRLVEIESNGWGDEAEALRRISRDCKLSFWTLNNLRIGRAKTVNADVRDRIRRTLIESCKKQAARLLHEAEVAAKMGRDNDALADVANQIRALAAELHAASDEKTEELT